MIIEGKRFGPSYMGMPEDCSISCPRCGSKAKFASPFGYISNVKPKELDSCNHLPLVEWSGGTAIVRFPDTFAWKDEHNPYTQCGTFNRQHHIWGVVNCPHCGCRRKHNLNWPADAYYQLSCRNAFIWGWTRRHFVAIRNFVESEDRNPRKHCYAGLRLSKLPKEILLIKNRSVIVKEIDKFLRNPEHRCWNHKPK
jgi:hypothetical protein